MEKIRLFQLFGVSATPTSHKEKIISGLGGFVGIVAIFVMTTTTLGIDEAIYIVPSMGASAVLLFAAPYAPFSQPWNVFAGHIVSAVVGVTCARYIPEIHIAAAASVGVAITAMYYTRCIHPPGGATALAAVIGGAQIQELGYMYVITPIMVDTLTILLIAVAFNAFFQWRRYPAFFAMKAKEETNVKEPYDAIKHEDFVYALSQIDSFIDVNEADLLKIYRLATENKRKASHKEISN